MLKENLLWNKVIETTTGRVVKEETFLGALIVSILILAGAIALFFLVGLAN
jgi:hypothetical protein